MFYDFCKQCTASSLLTCFNNIINKFIIQLFNYKQYLTITK
nr:MAG TPA: hypothetical protein [Caudoviricetes sp.]DAQ39858.1 MAG TPA: hypothetical protein [Bacteriophage sp.]DAM82772.1 MAG TPA: hypothetical protein [Caudoviricetes sp.]DAP26276.1 MAG TPA: hypothetical protein [Caudoviricetes sp.]DAQ32242.1 MAG TPA: hypothetical protein [Caudoviricetes sp.]